MMAMPLTRVEPGEFRARIGKDAEMWMKNRLDGTIHEALDTDVEGIAFSDKKKIFITAPEEGEPVDLIAIYQEAETKKKNFVDVTNEYAAAAKKEIYDPDIDIEGEHTWEQVLEKLNNFTEKYEKDAVKGIKGFFRKCARTCGDNSAVFQSWLGLLPTQSHYLSVLCGGLKLILDAAKRISDIRFDVHQLIEEIPSKLSNTGIIQDVFRCSPALHKCSAALYVAILNTLESIVQWCQKRVLAKFSMALLKQPRFADNIKTAMKTVEKCSADFEYRARVCNYEQQNLMKRMMETSNRDTDRGFNTLALHVSRSIQDLKEDQHATIKKTVSEVLNNFMHHLTSYPVPYRSGTPQEQYLAVKEYGTQTLIRPASPSMLDRVQQKKTTLWQIEKLLAALNIDCTIDIAAHDVSSLLQLAGTLSISSQDRSVNLIQSRQLQNWVTSTISSTLLVNGHMFTAGGYEERKSPLSFVCAKLVEALIPQIGLKCGEGGCTVFAVRWFCGQHTDMADYGSEGTDYDAHPIGMMNNLLSQFLRQIYILSRDSDTHLDLGDVTALSGFSNSRTTDLCQLFAELVGLLPYGTIFFCVLDGISYYEDASRCDELLEVISTLVSLSGMERGGCIFKLLATAPLRSHAVKNMFAEQDILDMDEYIPPAGGWTSLQWSAGIGNDIEVNLGM